MERCSAFCVRNTATFAGLSRIALPTSRAACASSLPRRRRNTSGSLRFTAHLPEAPYDPGVVAETYSSRSQYSVRPSKEKPINPRTRSFFPPSVTAIEHLYAFPLLGSTITPPDHWSPFFVRSQMIRSPTRLRSLRSPEHRTQRG